MFKTVVLIVLMMYMVIGMVLARAEDWLPAVYVIILGLISILGIYQMRIFLVLFAKTMLFP